MSFRKKITFLVLSALLSSCAYLKNPSEVMMTIDSEPLGAKIYVDDKYYGETVMQLHLVPDKDYKLKLVKDGFHPVEDIMRTEFSFREKRKIDRKRCKSDMIFSPLILPFFSLMSPKCRDFEKIVYFFDMTQIEVPVESIDQNVSPESSVLQPENVTKNAKLKNSKPENTKVYYTIPSQPTKPMSSSYIDPYQNYASGNALNQEQGVSRTQVQVDSDSAYKAPIYYDQNYQPVASKKKYVIKKQVKKPAHVY